mmetsp:Transcript_29160/g.25750  ORF Transcript_29160/g.25750 Transcript_29160/m.25750 type:complete len:112 (+) Transcript_29160:366-701(+)
MTATICNIRHKTNNTINIINMQRELVDAPTHPKNDIIIINTPQAIATYITDKSTDPNPNRSSSFSLTNTANAITATPTSNIKKFTKKRQFFEHLAAPDNSSSSGESSYFPP